MANSVAPAGKVMRHPAINSLFRRTMPDGVLMVFEPKIPVDLDSSQMERVLDDIGYALVMVDIDEKGKIRVDWDLTKSVRDNEPPAPPSGEVEVELSDELLSLLEIHADKFPELSPVGLQLFLDEGGDLESLEGFTPELAQELRDSLAAKLPDVTKLVAAGLDQDLIDMLVANVDGEDSEWLLEPNAIVAKVTEGFKLESLDRIGPVSARKIRKALGI